VEVGGEEAEGANLVADVFGDGPSKAKAVIG